MKASAERVLPFFVTLLLAGLALAAVVGGFEVCYGKACINHVGIDLNRLSVRLKAFE